MRFDRAGHTGREGGVMGFREKATTEERLDICSPLQGVLLLYTHILPVVLGGGAGSGPWGACFETVGPSRLLYGNSLKVKCCIRSPFDEKISVVD